jgi:deoxyribose-phosphate aldolase
MIKLTNNDIVSMIDLSCVKAENTYEDIRKMVTLAKEYNILCTFTLPSHVPYLVELLGDRKDILIGGAVGFPDGGATTNIKVQTTRELISFGANEIDMVMNITWLKAGKNDWVKQDIDSVKEAANGLPVKVILEVAYLTEKEIRTACEIAVEAGAAFIKTGTGWAPKDTSLDHIRIIADAVKNRCGIKAAGGIRTKEVLSSMHDLGVTRFGIGTASALSIINS